MIRMNQCLYILYQILYKNPSKFTMQWAGRPLIDLLPNEQHFDLVLDKNFLNQKTASLKEHHKISNIPKFRCEML